MENEPYPVGNDDIVYAGTRVWQGEIVCLGILKISVVHVMVFGLL